nr:hypothetical protein [Microbacterium sp. EF45047]
MPAPTRRPSGSGAAAAITAAVVGDADGEEAEGGGCCGEHGDRDHGADAHPAEARLLHVRGEVVEHRDHEHHEEEQCGPPQDPPGGEHRLPRTEEVGESLRERPRRDGQGDGGEHQHEHEHGHQQVRRLRLPVRPTLGDAVHPVHRASEGGDVAGDGPQRDDEADRQGHSGPGGGGELLDRLLHRGGHLRREHLADEVEHHPLRVPATPEQADEGEPGDERREQGEQRVEGQARGGVRAFVGREPVHDAPDDVRRDPAPAPHARAPHAGSLHRSRRVRTSLARKRMPVLRRPSPAGTAAEYSRALPAVEGLGRPRRGS